ncbi:aspartic endopeptidase Pep2 [Apiospora saccharicola]|uniref:Aspartic endopeptidase Pep2 n=1 Tax=Apiospora saccharicola TaxID=335842 RepID=A0ABR1UF01_9PEZI
MRLLILTLASSILGFSLAKRRDELQQVLLSRPERALLTVELRELVGNPIGIVALAAVGTPPQPFRLLVDLLEGPFFLPGAGIEDEEGGTRDDLNLYFANESTTYASGGHERLRREHGGVYFWGELTTDTFRIAGLDLSRQPFLHADRRRTTSRRSLPRDPAYGPATGHTGEEPVCHIHPERGGRGVGRAHLRRYRPRLHLEPLPLRPARGARRRRGDLVGPAAVAQLTWANGSEDPLHQDFPAGATAVLTTEWFAAVPRAFRWRWARDVAVGCAIMHMHCEVDCARRAGMPDTVVGLGEHEFRVAARQYARPIIRARDGRELCLVSMVDAEQLRDPRGPLGGTNMVFGLSFLRAFYSVFDLDQREIRLTEKLAV